MLTYLSKKKIKNALLLNKNIDSQLHMLLNKNIDSQLHNELNEKRKMIIRRNAYCYKYIV